MSFKIMCLFLILVVAVYGTPLHYQIYYGNPRPYPNGPGQSVSVAMYTDKPGSSYDNAQPGGGPGYGQDFPDQNGYGGYADYRY